jgi:TonB-linked SusC/RagA family outer membrane protein
MLLIHFVNDPKGIVALLCDQPINQPFMKKSLLPDREKYACMYMRQSPQKQTKKNISLLFAFCLLFSINALAQSTRITGDVFSSSGEALIGVSVVVKGTQTGTQTDVNGKFSIDVNGPGSTLLFSYVGFLTKEVQVKNLTNIRVDLQSSGANDLKEVVVTGYGSQKRESITSAIASTSSKELDRVHGAATVSRALAGKLPGITFKASDGRPGSSASISIRGLGSPLFVIDGVQTDEGQFNNISPNDVESISILKDASAAIYGVRAANGVVVVTTKKGTGESRVTADAYLGWQNFYRFPEALSSSYDFAMFRNEAAINGNPTATPPYNASELEKFRTEADRDHRSFDWKKFIVDDNANRRQNFVNLNIQGGNEKVNYYVSASSIYQESTLGKEYQFQRQNLQSNITTKLATGLSVGIILNGRIETRDNPGVPNEDDYDQARYAELRNSPLERPYANDNPEYLNDIGHNNSNYAYLQNRWAGHRKDTWRIVTPTFKADYKIPGIKGLSLSGLYNYYFADRLMDNFEYTFKAYTYSPSANTYTWTGGSTNPYRQRITAKVFNTTSQLQLAYVNTFGKHNINATLVSERYTVKNLGVTVHSVPISNNLSLFYFPTMDQYDDTETNQARIGYALRFQYNYANKYYAEFAGRRDQSFLFAPGYRTGYFPGGSIGWRITEEKWLKNLLGGKTFINDVKLRGSYGSTGDDRDQNGNPITAQFTYLPGYNYKQPVAIIDGNAVITARDKGIASPIISWTRSTHTDIGLDFTLFDSHLSGAIDYFYRKRTGLLTARADVAIPTELGYTPSQENLNSDARYGQEFSLAYNNRIGEVSYNIGGNISYTRGKNLNVLQDAYNLGNSLDVYRNGTANRFQRIDWGYLVDGQFTSQEQINNYKVNIDGRGNASLLPGDLIYKDVNNDGRITDADQRPIGFGNGSPNINFGFTLGASYKNFTFNADFSGGAGYSYYQTNEAQVPFTNNGNLNVIFEDRWHHEDPLNPSSPWIPGKYPAIRYNNTGSGFSNFERNNNSFYGHNVFYIRARTIELSYSLPQTILSYAKIKKARFYVNGYNMLSFDNLKSLNIDPEATDSNGQQVSQTKVINVGVNLVF